MFFSWQNTYRAAQLATACCLLSRWTQEDSFPYAQTASGLLCLYEGLMPTNFNQLATLAQIPFGCNALLWTCVGLAYEDYPLSDVYQLNLLSHGMAWANRYIQLGFDIARFDKEEQASQSSKPK